MKWKTWLLSTIVAGGLLLPYAQPSYAATVEEDADALAQAYVELLKHYSKPDQEKLFDAALKAMMEELKDPYTNYMSAEEYGDFLGALNQNYAGVGISGEVASDGKGVTISRVFKDSPADQAGLQIGDIIRKVDGQEAPEGTPGDLMLRIRGEAGTPVVLSVERNGVLLEKTLTRVEIHLPLVNGQPLGDGIEYIQITSFGESTTAEFTTAFNAAQERNAKGMVIDLRGNGGGYVVSALEIGDILLKEGTMLIVHDELGQPIHLDSDPEGTDLPITVLIDQHTASASEMLAGALQKNGRATIIGTTSFGKGTMQSPYELPNGAFLKVSVDRWELPDGSHINETGLQPDIYLSRPDSQLNAAIQVLSPGREQKLSYSLREPTAVLNLDQQLIEVEMPLRQEETWYVPLRYSVESFGSQVSWSAGVTSFTLNGAKVELNTGQGTASVNGRPVSLPSAGLLLKDGTTYVSADVWGKLTGHAADVTGETLTIYNK